MAPQLTDRVGTAGIESQVCDSRAIYVDPTPVRIDGSELLPLCLIAKRLDKLEIAHTMRATEESSSSPLLTYDPLHSDIAKANWAAPRLPRQCVCWRPSPLTSLCLQAKRLHLERHTRLPATQLFLCLEYSI